MSIFEHINELKEWKEDSNYMISSILPSNTIIISDDNEFSDNDEPYSVRILHRNKYMEKNKNKNKKYFIKVDCDIHLNLNHLRFDGDDEEIKLIYEQYSIVKYRYRKELCTIAKQIYKHGDNLYIHVYGDTRGHYSSLDFDSLYSLLKKIKVKKYPSTIEEIVKFIEDSDLESAAKMLRSIFHNNNKEIEMANEAFRICAAKFVAKNMPFKFE